MIRATIPMIACVDQPRATKLYRTKADEFLIPLVDATAPNLAAIETIANIK